jgi:pyruvate dehydrogenase E2 component (dihydrolipoyllysine-residue acetyltransferase)
MKIPVMLPQLTETMDEATITTWHKKPGNLVAKRELLFEVETDKMTMEVEAIDAGVLCEILVGDNEVATVGQTVANLADSPEGC